MYIETNKIERVHGCRLHVYYCIAHSDSMQKLFDIIIEQEKLNAYPYLGQTALAQTVLK